MAEALRPFGEVTATRRASAAPRGAGGFAEAAGITLAGTVISAAAAFLTEIMIARHLGVETYGLYGLGFVIAKIGGLVAMFGLPLTLFHFIPEYLAAKRGRFVCGVLISGTLGPILIGGLLAALIWVTAPILAEKVFTAPGASFYIRLLGLSVPFVGVTNVLANATRALGHPGYLVLARNVVPAFLYVALLGCVILFGAAPIAIALAFIAANIGGALVGIVGVIRTAGRTNLCRRPVIEWGKTYGYAVPIAVNMLLYVGISWTDILMVGHFLGPREVGIYRACLQIVIPFDMIWFAFNSASAHAYSTLAKSGDRARLSAEYGTTLRWSVMASIPLAVLIALNGRDILSLLGPHFSEGADVLAILTLSQALRSAIGASGFLLAVSGFQSLEAVNALVAAIAAIVFNLLLVPRAGILGAATATLATMVLFHILRVIQVRLYFHVPTVRLAHLGVLAASVAAAVGIGFAFGILGLGLGSGIVALTLRSFVETLAVLIVIWKWGCAESDRALLRRAIRFVRVPGSGSRIGTE